MTAAMIPTTIIIIMTADANQMIHVMTAVDVMTGLNPADADNSNFTALCKREQIFYKNTLDSNFTDNLNCDNIYTT